MIYDDLRKVFWFGLVVGTIAGVIAGVVAF